MRAGIVTIGDEILIGQIVDTNSTWIAHELSKIGVEVVLMQTVSDTQEAIETSIAKVFERVDIIIMTGGLGPTKDDVTKHVLTHLFDDELVLDGEVLEHIKEMFAARNIPFSTLNEQQALLPKKCTVLPNKMGTASGMWFERENKFLISLPGVPYEMKHLMVEQVIPKMQQNFSMPFISHKTYVVYGVPESELAMKLDTFENKLSKHVKLAYLPSPGRVRLRISILHKNEEIVKKAQAEAYREMKVIFDHHSIVFAEDKENAVLQLKELLTKQGKTLAIAESCTGGKIASEITQTPGVSSFFKGGIVAYSAQIKEKVLKVDKDTIEKYSVVSEQVAKEMAVGVSNLYQTDYSIGVTGNAGPTPDKTDESVGVVYIAIKTPESIIVEKFNFGQPREKVIEQAKNKALELLRKQIIALTTE